MTSPGKVQSWIQSTAIHHLLLTMIKVMTQSGRMLKRERRAWYHSCISHVIGGPDYQPAVIGWGMEERARKHVEQKKKPAMTYELLCSWRDVARLQGSR